MTDPAAIVRRAFPAWRRDPYQRVAVNALLRILFAGENAERALADVETCIAFFLEDPPLSLAFCSPRLRVEALAKRFDVLAGELRKAANQLQTLEPYVDQFNHDSLSERKDADASIRKQTPGGGYPTTAASIP